MLCYVCNCVKYRTSIDDNYGSHTVTCNEGSYPANFLVLFLSLLQYAFEHPQVAHDDRCKILISSLQDTLHGVETKSYGSGERRRSRSRDRDARAHHRTPRRRERSASRYRDRSRDREDRDRLGTALPNVLCLYAFFFFLGPNNACRSGQSSRQCQTSTNSY